MDFKHPPLNSPFIQMTKTLIRFQNTDNVLSLSWFSFSLSNGFWLSVLLVSRVSKSTFRRSWLGFRPNSAHTGKSGAKDFMFGCLSFVFISGMRPSLFLSVALLHCSYVFEILFRFHQVCVVYGLKEADLKGEGNHYMIADLVCLLLFFFFL
ncbi:hypothetical protein HanXRQr2_Chr04g0168911 [Helianthus annuus]|uniref:Transmembrane protein n=1 Tax=Helianthus annuus TaxID=4232 RepID=A0A9K3J7S7_HELAN|nr:hypothetical protein HanXRQr2_Chr04g0168911 [Helianthus annuus]